MDANDITTATDTAYVARIGSSKSYLPGVSVRTPPYSPSIRPALTESSLRLPLCAASLLHPLRSKSVPSFSRRCANLPNV